jgi:hypothetical protein
MDTQTYTQESKKRVDTRPLLSRKLHLAELVTLPQVLFFPTKFIHEGIDALLNPKLDS